MLNIINFLAINVKKFTIIFVPSILIFDALVIILLLLILNKKRKNDLDISENNEKINESNEKFDENNEKIDEDIVKTVYSNKENNFSKTEDIPVPENFSTPEFDFEFAGWDKFYVDENGETKLNAIWTRVPREYKVTIFGADKLVPMEERFVNFGATVDLSQLNPQKESDDEFDYVFIGWDKVPSEITCDMEIHALYETKNKAGETVSVDEFKSAEEKTNDDGATSNSDANNVAEDAQLEKTENTVEESSNQELDFESIEKDLTELENGKEDLNSEQNIQTDETEIIESVEEKENVNFDEPSNRIKTYTDEDSLPLANNIKVGKPAIVHGVNTTTKSKNGYKIEKSENYYNSSSINVDNKYSNFENDDIFKRAGIAVHGVKPAEYKSDEKPESSKPEKFSISGPAYKNTHKPVTVEPKDDSTDDTEQFLTNSMLVSHRKMIKK